MEYKISGDIRKKEKVVGGVLTLTQLIFAVLAALFGGLAVYLIWRWTGSIVFGLILGVIAALPFIPFVFVTIEKMGDMELAKYLWIRYKFSKSQKIFLNVNEKYKAYVLERAKAQTQGGNSNA